MRLYRTATVPREWDRPTRSAFLRAQGPVAIHRRSLRLSSIYLDQRYERCRFSSFFVIFFVFVFPYLMSAGAETGCDCVGIMETMILFGR